MALTYCIHEKKREEKQAIKEGKCISTAITYMFTSEISPFLSGSRWNESLYFMSSVIVLNEFSSVETITKTMFLRLQSVLPLITTTDDRPVLPNIINTLLVFFLSNNYCYVFPYAKTNNLEKFSIV